MQEPEGPTDEEIMERKQQMRDDLAAAARALGRLRPRQRQSRRSAMRIILNRHAVDHARASLLSGATND
jgi:hypothetical protein